MKKGSTVFLRFTLYIIALLALSAMVWFPQTEGRAVDHDLVGIYADPFILYVYIASIPFFAALYQASKLLGYVEKNKIFSRPAIKAVRNIKYCALGIGVFLVGALLYIQFMVRGDDPAGPTMLGLVALFALLVIAVGAGVAQTLLQKAVDIQSENDLTV